MGARYKGCLINVGWPQPGSRLEGRRRGSSSWEAPGSLEETSAVQPAALPSRFCEAEKKKEIKEEKGPAPAGMVGIPAAYSLAERVGALPPEA